MMQSAMKTDIGKYLIGQKWTNVFFESLILWGWFNYFFWKLDADSDAACSHTCLQIDKLKEMCKLMMGSHFSWFSTNSPLWSQVTPEFWSDRDDFFITSCAYNCKVYASIRNRIGHQLAELFTKTWKWPVFAPMHNFCICRWKMSAIGATWAYHMWSRQLRSLFRKKTSVSQFPLYGEPVSFCSSGGTCTFVRNGFSRAVVWYIIVRRDALYRMSYDTCRSGEYWVSYSIFRFFPVICHRNLDLVRSGWKFILFSNVT
jgi:hypothetical protein